MYVLLLYLCNIIQIPYINCGKMTPSSEDHTLKLVKKFPLHFVESKVLLLCCKQQPTCF